MRRLASLATAPLAVRAPEAVGTALVVGADANGEVVRGQLHVAAARAVRPDRRHRLSPSLVVLWTHDVGPSRHRGY